MAYEKTVWKNVEDPDFDPNTDPKIEADNLNHIEDGIYNVDTALSEHTGASSGVHGVTGTVLGSEEKGVANGLATLDENVDVPLDQIPDTLTGKDADTLDSKHYSDIASEIDSDISAHSALDSGVHGVTGTVLGSEDKAVANGLATLDENVKVPLGQIPDTLTGKDADTVDGKHYSDIASEIDSDVSAHSALDSGVHGVTGTVLGSEDVDVANGVAALDSAGNLRAQGNTLYLRRDGTDKIRIHDRESGDTWIYGIRYGENNWDLFLYEGGGVGTKMLHENMKNVANGVAGLDANADVPLDQIPDTLTGKDADTLDSKHYSDIASEIDSDISAHSALDSGVHGVTGTVLGSEDKDVVDGVAALDGAGNLLSRSNLKLYATDGVYFRIINRNTDETILRFKRIGEDDYEIHLHEGGSYQTILSTGDRDVADGVAALDSSGDLLAQGDILYLKRSGANKIRIHERDTGETFIYGVRQGENDWDIHLYNDGSDVEILHANMKNVADGVAGLTSRKTVVTSDRLQFDVDGANQFWMGVAPDDDSDIAMKLVRKDVSDYDLYVRQNNTSYLVETVKDKDTANGYAALDSGGNLLADGAVLYLKRNADDKIRIHDRESGETWLYGQRLGENDWTLVLYADGGTGSFVLHEGNKNVAGGVAGLDANADVPEEHLPHTLNDTFRFDNTTEIKRIKALDEGRNVYTDFVLLDGTPDTSIHIVPNYVKNESATSIACRFGYNSEIKMFDWFSKWGGTNKQLFRIYADSMAADFGTDGAGVVLQLRSIDSNHEGGRLLIENPTDNPNWYIRGYDAELRFQISSGLQRTVRVHNIGTNDVKLLVDGVFSLLERTSDPSAPSEGEAIIWMSDGTGKGDDGDVLIASTAGGTTKWTTLLDHSAGNDW